MSDTYSYMVDREFRIVSVNDAFLSFAAENEAGELTRDYVCGRSLLDFVADAETRYLYRLLIDKVNAGGRPLRIAFRCDSPTLRRYMELEIVPAGDGLLQFISRLLRTEARAPVPLFDVTEPRSEETVMVCSWCKRLRVQAGWEEAEEAIGRLGLFDSGMLPRLSHGICRDCHDRVVRSLEYPADPGRATT